MNGCLSLEFESLKSIWKACLSLQSLLVCIHVYYWKKRNGNFSWHFWDVHLVSLLTLDSQSVRVVNQNWCFKLLFFTIIYAKLCWDVIDNCLVKTIIVSCMSHVYRWTTFTNYMGQKLKLLNSQMHNLEPFGSHLAFQSELPSCPSWWWHWCSH